MLRSSEVPALALRVCRRQPPSAMTPDEGRRPLLLAGSSLRWAVGLFCSFIGAFMLVAPHQFGNRAFASVRAYQTAWAIAALGAGVALLSAGGAQAGGRPGRAGRARPASPLLTSTCL
jgi:hypothetical protein